MFNTPETYASGDVPTHVQFNEGIRDNLNHLGRVSAEGPIPLSGLPATAANSTFTGSATLMIQGSAAMITVAGQFVANRDDGGSLRIRWGSASGQYHHFLGDDGIYPLGDNATSPIPNRRQAVLSVMRRQKVTGLPTGENELFVVVGMSRASMINFQGYAQEVRF